MSLFVIGIIQPAYKNLVLPVRFLAVNTKIDFLDFLRIHVTPNENHLRPVYRNTLR